MKTKITALFLSIFLLFTFFGCRENSNDNTDKPKETRALAVRPDHIFETDDITQITLYLYYGQGKGSKVPAENMTEIIDWLDTFTLGEQFKEELIPPGTNTYHVEIEYSDGTTVKSGLDVISLNGLLYYINSGEAPDCYWDIISGSVGHWYE